MREILCEENGYQLIVEQVENFQDDGLEVIELEVVENIESELHVEKESLINILKKFVKSYCINKKNNVLTSQEWLKKELKSEFPEKSDDELKKISEELQAGIEGAEKRYKEIESYSSMGITASDYLGKEIEENTIDNAVNSELSVAELKDELRKNSELLNQNNLTESYKLAGKTGAEIIVGLKAFDKMDKYFTNINETIARGNEKMIETITTKVGTINQNPNLDGFIFEQFHENTFNIDAAIKDAKGIRAVALVPEAGNSYGKNSIDLVVKISKDGREYNIKKYQAKLSKTGEKADVLFNNKNYKFQRKLYGKGQEKHGNTKVEYAGIESKAFSKEEIKKIQNKVQSGNVDSVKTTFKEDIDIKKLSKQIGKQALYSCGIAVGTGMAFSIAEKIINKENIEIEEVIVDGLKTGATAGISTAVAGGLRTAVEKGIIRGVGTKILSNNIISSIAFSTVSIVGVGLAVGSGEISLKEGTKESGKILASTYAGLKGAAVGSTLATGILTVGSVIAPVVAAVAGTIGYLVSSKVATHVYEGITEIGSTIVSGVGSVISAGYRIVKNECKGIMSEVGSIVSGVKSVISCVGSWLFG